MGNKEQFEQLMLVDNEGKLSFEEQQFKDLHDRICYNAKQAAKHWVEMAQDIKEMRDSKHYQVAGFDSFGDYTENALGIKERQAYNYIAVVDKLPEDFVKSYASIGVTKLALLTSVDDEERQELLERIDLNTAKTSEISATVKEIMAERDDAMQQLSLLKDENVDLEQKNEIIHEENVSLAKENARTQDENRRLEQENDELKKQLEDAKNAVVYQKDPKQAEALQKAKEREKALKEDVESKKKELAEARDGKKALEEEVETLRAELEQAKADVKTATAPTKVEIKDDVLVVFKVKFKIYQDLLYEMSELIQKMDKSDATRCRMAVRAVIDDSDI